MVFWQLFYHLHVLFPLSLHCSLLMHINISCKIYIKVSANWGWKYYSNIPVHAINVHHHCQLRSIGCCRLQPGCRLHHRAADSALASWCSFISQQISNTIFFAFAIIGVCIKIEKLSIRKRSMYIYISGWHTFDFRMVRSLIGTRWRRWHFRRRWRRVWWRFTRSIVPPACLRILCCAILARKAAIHLIFKNHCWVSSYRSHHLVMPRKLHTSLRLFSDCGTRFLYQILHFLYCGARKPSFGHLGHIDG